MENKGMEKDTSCMYETNYSSTYKIRENVI